MNNEHIKEQKENIKPASDPWKATPEQKKFYSDEFEKLPKVQGMGLRVDLSTQKYLEAITFHRKIQPKKNILKVIYVHLLKEQ